MTEETIGDLEEKTFAELLALTPPGNFYAVPDFVKQGNALQTVLRPDLLMYCSSETCYGDRFFESVQINDSYSSGGFKDFSMKYLCRNCKKTTKFFALMAISPYLNAPSMVIKLGEYPTFGPHTPARLISLIGPDKDYFLQGRRAENLGLGIGAFAYYRRVIENQKGRLIREIAKVAKRLGAEETILQQFEKAANETQFDRAITDIKGAIPQSLMIRGHNPLKLLHSALSEGIHAQSDAECLDIATSIRVVLAELAERITTALKEEAELTSAVNRLLQPSKTTQLSLPSKGESEQNAEKSD